ncbi:hypothetical protein BJX61DRAFT_129390 [Aspergillus egyptiacus]|nr:hypothetical protein BJX61DRAFT_129390 [Aspergillus egyptiacus]
MFTTFIMTEMNQDRPSAVKSDLLFRHISPLLSAPDNPTAHETPPPPRESLMTPCLYLSIHMAPQPFAIPTLRLKSSLEPGNSDLPTYLRSPALHQSRTDRNNHIPSNTHRFHALPGSNWSQGQEVARPPSSTEKPKNRAVLNRDAVGGRSAI